jgi:uncharacterized protein
MPFPPGGSPSCTLDLSVFPGTIRPHDGDSNSRRHSSGPRWDCRSTWRAVWGGGGFLVIPLLGFFYGMDQQTAQGTVLIIVVPNVVRAFSRYRRRSAHGGDHRRVGFGCNLSGGPFGDWSRPACPAARLRPLSRHDCRDRRLPHVAWCCEGWRRADASLGLDNGRRAYRRRVLGVFRGRRGVRCAAAAVTTFFGLRQLEAQGLALALVSPSALIALLAYAEAGRVDWVVGLPLALGGIAAISAGVSFASRLPERRMRLAFCGLLLITAVLLALRG